MPRLASTPRRIAIALVTGVCCAALAEVAWAQRAEQDPRRPETLVFDGSVQSWRALDLGRSSLRLLPGWKLYPEKLAKDGRPPWLVAARSIDRVVGRAIHVDADNIGLFLAGTKADPEDKVRDRRAAETLFRTIVDARAIESAVEGGRFLAAARLLETTKSSGGVSRSRGVHEHLHQLRVTVHDDPRIAWRIRVEPFGEGFAISGSFYRRWPSLQLVEVQGTITRSAQIRLRERTLVDGPSVVWSTLSLATDARSAAREARLERERRDDVRLAQRRFAAALDPRRTIEFARRLCARRPAATRKSIIAALGEPDHRVGREEGVLVYGMWNGKVLEFVGSSRIRELRLAEVPRTRTALSDERISGPTIERLWVRSR